jgi:hypothetical protein
VLQQKGDCTRQREVTIAQLLRINDCVPHRPRVATGPDNSGHSFILLAAVYQVEATLKLEEHTGTMVQPLLGNSSGCSAPLNMAIARGPTLACMSVCAGSTPCSGFQHKPLH